jgi:hypothetical protein
VTRRNVHAVRMSHRNGYVPSVTGFSVKYAEAIGTIERGRIALRPPPAEVLKTVTDLLQADVPIRATLLLFVGGFDNNAFTAPGRDGIPTVAIPVEGEPLNLVLTHEFTHVVEGEQAQLSFGWERSVAHTIFTEGLAMRATQKLDPGHPNKTYTGEFTPNWFARAETKRSEILADITPHLEESDATAVMRYTMGIGGPGWSGKGTMPVGWSSATFLIMGGRFRDWLVSRMLKWQLSSKKVSVVCRLLVCKAGSKTRTHALIVNPRRAAGSPKANSGLSGPRTIPNVLYCPFSEGTPVYERKLVAGDLEAIKILNRYLARRLAQRQSDRQLRLHDQFDDGRHRSPGGLLDFSHNKFSFSQIVP